MLTLEDRKSLASIRRKARFWIVGWFRDCTNKTRHFIADQVCKRLTLGQEKYHNTWLVRDNLAEALPEALDGMMYAFFELEKGRIFAKQAQRIAEAFLNAYFVTEQVMAERAAATKEGVQV